MFGRVSTVALIGFETIETIRQSLKKFVLLISVKKNVFLSFLFNKVDVRI